MSATSSNNQAMLATVGRVLIAVIFIMSGFGKIGAPEATQGYIASVGMPAPLLAYIGAVIVELGGGILLILGYRARLVAAIMAIFTVVAALYFHRAFGDQNQMVHFLKNISMAGGLLQVVAFGAGAFSLDNRRTSAPVAAR
ncbi:MAG TPA: DoxX family protein [Herbaspirillum sp.]|jgi:putative oxidoreductase